MRNTTKLLSLLLCLTMVLAMAACGGGDDSASAAEPPPFADEPEYEPGKDDSSAGSESISEPESISEVESTEPESTEPESKEPAKQGPPAFVEDTPAVSASGSKATVTFKTDVPSTVNVILSTSGAGIGTSAFYDYFNRGKGLDGAVSKKQLFDVSTAGSSVSFDIPDATKGYFLLVNAAENASGTWQGAVSVITLFDPAKTAPSFTDSVSFSGVEDGKAKFSVKTNMPAIVYCIITDSKAATPTAKQVQEAGTGYSGVKIYASTSGGTKGDKAPYKGSVSLSTSGMESGNYVAWFVLQNNDGPLGDVGKANFSV